MRSNILTVFLAATLSALAVGAFLRVEQVESRAAEDRNRAAQAEAALWAKGGAETTNSATAAYAGHANVACTSGGTALPALPVADGLGALHGNARQFFITPTSTDIVRLVSKNGVAAAQGTPICTDKSLGCVTSMPMPTSTELWTCVADSTTATLSLLGVRY